ncbi:MAG: phosphoribosylglycinamide formyltransferase [Armatimonadetes bacterium JP3_11]|nr:MAG: phosphoribosylglycinamide formyltransferase [Armatimonadetes bacterium CP1_7O]OYT74380.1 MAG: phosphoribosylglycinamide formyltransferase [Armatimonadetes bacterium JP3_11]RMH06352.1 MAG: phosphoribosylglycinamide formyltransferase [Armatimonadota bacterium]
MKRIVILVSGPSRGSNMRAIIEACREGRIPDSEVVAVIGAREDAPALQHAHALGVPTAVVNPNEFPEPDMYGDALMWVLQKAQPDLICLAGYMRLLPKQIVQAYPLQILNIHPALLPLFGGKGMYGLKVHQAVIESGMKVTGCTVHFVDEQYDTGPIVLQRCIPVMDDDTPETLAARLLPVEHETYIEAVRLFVEGRLRLEGKRVKVVG